MRVAESWHPDGGWEFIAALEHTRGAKPVAAWGEDGWDLGDWPAVVYGHARTPDGFALVGRVDGDVTVSVYPTRLELIEATDEAAEQCWRRNPERYGLTDVTARWPEGRLPDRYRGPFSRSARDWWRVARAKRGAA